MKTKDNVSVTFRDMANLFEERLHKLLRDHFDTCQMAELDVKDSLEILLGGLVLEFIRGAVASQMSEDDFMQICRGGYRSVAPKLREEYACHAGQN